MEELPPPKHTKNQAKAPKLSALVIRSPSPETAPAVPPQVMGKGKEKVEVCPLASKNKSLPPKSTSKALPDHFLITLRHTNLASRMLRLYGLLKEND